MGVLCDIRGILHHHFGGDGPAWTFDVPLQQEEITRTALDQSHESKQDGVTFHLKEILTAKASSSLVYETVQKYKDDDVRIKKGILVCAIIRIYCLPLYRYVPDTDPQYHILFESRHDHEKDQEG